MNYKIINEKFDILLIQRKAMKGRPLTRRFISYVYRNILSILFFIKIRDFNGLIIINKKKIKNLNLCSKSFFISAEILIKSIKKKLGMNDSYYFSVETKKKYKSTSLTFKQFFLLLNDLIKTYNYLIFK